MKSLEDWKTRKNRKPLVLRGARQVGKTTLVQEFGKSFDVLISINLEKSRDKAFFTQYGEVPTIMEALYLAHNIIPKEGQETLLFIDEIQEEPKAIQLLRYFYEEIPDLHVIAAGSLLEFAIQEVRSFPVGRIEFLYLFPLNFSEYLQATGQIAAYMKLETVPVSEVAHNILLQLFHRYAIIGGMPEIIQRTIDGETLSQLPRTYESIWGTYKEDVEKYTSNATERKVIRHIMDTAPMYLDQRIKFQNFGNSNYRSREVGEALRNLDAAKIIQLIYPTTELTPPIKPNLRKSPRLQFLDTGLVNHTLNIQGQLLGLSDLNDAMRGGIIPHLITQELISLQTINYHKPHFWVREKSQASSEVDLVYTYNDMIIPIEIKSGPTGSLKSLHQFMDRAPHSYAVRMYAGKFKIETAVTDTGTKFLLMNLPYYLGSMLPTYIRIFTDSAKLS
jgi:hypothetical protein